MHANREYVILRRIVYIDVYVYIFDNSTSVQQRGCLLCPSNAYPPRGFGKLLDQADQIDQTLVSRGALEKQLNQADLIRLFDFK